MTVSDIKKICQIPEKDLLYFLLNQINLSSKERTVIELCFIEEYTEEQSAERLDRSVNTIKDWKKSAINKINKVWSQNRIIEILLNNI